MIMALLRAKLDAAKLSNRDVEAAETGLDTAERIGRTEQRPEISDALRKSMTKRDRGNVTSNLEMSSIWAHIELDPGYPEEGSWIK